MVAQLFALKLRLLANNFRRTRWQSFGLITGVVIVLALAGLVCAALIARRSAEDITVTRDILTVAGAVVMIGFLVAPIIVGVNDRMDPRRFALFGLEQRTLSWGLALCGLLGVPTLALTAALISTVIVWSSSAAAMVVASVAALLALATCVLGTRIMVVLRSLLITTGQARIITGLIGIFLLLMLSPATVALTTVEWETSGFTVLGNIAAVVRWTPFGAVFAAPGDIATGTWVTAILQLLIAVVTLFLMWWTWRRVLSRALATPERNVSTKTHRRLGWFNLMPNGEIGVIAARSTTYWLRDSRYWVSVVAVLITPLVVLVVLACAGVPPRLAALLPVPIMALFLGWSLHNDTAHDSTAIWLHVVSGTRGVNDRIGRIVPVLATGIAVIVAGSALSVYLVDEWWLLPPLLGASAALLLGGLGVGSISSARFPYPAVRPGDSPFQQPQSTDMGSAMVQALTLIIPVLIALPALVFGIIGIAHGASWLLVSLAVGIVSGVIALVIGVAVGGKIFDRRGPEILAAALHAQVHGT